MNERIICVCCEDGAVVVFNDKTALCFTHARIYQMILEHEGKDIKIHVMEENELYA